MAVQRRAGEYELAGELERLEGAAVAGSVANSRFLEPDASARLLHALAERSVSANAWGGFPGARRRVVTAYPSHVPNAATQLVAVYFETAAPARSLVPTLVATGTAEADLGDAVEHQGGVSLVALETASDRLLAPLEVAGARVVPRSIPLERVASGSVRSFTSVVASLRVDALGAKAFRVSRSYFAKGVAGGKVSVNGGPAGKSSSAEPGDEIYAEGLGRFRVVSVDGETRRGNVKVSLEVESS